MPAAAEPLHTATANVADVLDVLLAFPGWLGTKDIAARSSTHRDTTRRILAELERRGWVEHRLVDETDAWAIGPELPRIGLAYLERLGAEQARLRGMAAHATLPWRSDARHTPDFSRQDDRAALTALLKCVGVHLALDVFREWSPSQRVSAWAWASSAAVGDELLAKMVPPHVRAIAPEWDR